MKGLKYHRVLLLASLLMMCLFLSGLFFYMKTIDNANSLPEILGNEGVLVVEGEELADIVPLRSGWAFYRGLVLTPKELHLTQAKPEYVTIGEYRNFEMGNPGNRPDGLATYHLKIYTEPNQTVGILIPNIYCAGLIYINGELVAENGVVGQGYQSNLKQVYYTFTTKAENDIVINVDNRSDFYSGMFYLPLLGENQALFSMVLHSVLVYGLVNAIALTVGMIAFLCWCLSGRKDKVMLYFCGICLFYTVYCGKELLVQIPDLPINAIFQGLRCTALVAINLCMVLLITEVTNGKKGFFYRLMLLLCSMDIVYNIGIYTLWRTNNLAIALYGYKCLLTNLLLVCYAVVVLVRQRKGLSDRTLFLMLGIYIYSISICLEILIRKIHQPLHLMRITEFSGFLLIIVFGITLAINYAYAQQNNQIMWRNFQTQRQMLSNIAHDLKAPMGNIMGYFELWESGVPAAMEDEHYYFQQIKTSSMALVDRVGNLQLVAELGEIPLRKKLVEVGDYLQVIERAYHQNPTLPPLRLFLPDEEVVYELDDKRFQIVMENLIDNAIKYTKTMVMIVVEVEEEGLLISVIDDGIGIEASRLPYVFDRFFTAQENCANKGLGLAVVKMIVNEHGGDIDVSSVINEGSKFTITLPWCT